jgi:deoxyribonuclease V
VVHQNGDVGDYRKGIRKKIDLLKGDGINIENGKIKNFEGVVFDDFDTDRPLSLLRDEQIELSEKVSTRDSFSIANIKVVGGIDVAYDGRNAYGAYVAMNWEGRLIDKKLSIATTNFPYIPTYLSYRELPAIEKLMEKIIEKPTVMMLDGNGLIHPRRIGLASHIGIVFDIPTIGIAKSLLLGEVKDHKVIDGKEILGYELKSSNKPIYISLGNKISLKSSIKIVEHFCKFRIPEPIRRANQLANEYRKSKNNE